LHCGFSTKSSSLLMLQRQHVQSTALIFVLTECLRPQSACQWFSVACKQGQRSRMTIGICMQRSCNGNCVISSGLSRPSTGPSIAHQPSEPSRVFGLRCFCAKPCYSWVAASTKMKCPYAISTVPNIALTDFPNRKAQISAEMMSAASKVGFFYVTGKRITSELTPLYPLVEEMCGACAVQGMGLHKLILMQRSQ